MSFAHCAFHTTHKSSFLDHIAPLASLLGIPLIISDEKNRERIAHYYPEVELRYRPDIEFRLQEIAEEFEGIFNCDYWSLAQKAAFQLYTKKTMRLIFCPHGQSDKGYQSASLAPYGWQETVLIYGSLLKEMLQALGLWDRIPQSFIVGNFRYRYFQVHRERLLQIARKEIFAKLQKANPTLLFAPTWNDAESSGTFFEYAERLSQELPSHWNLIVKVHPEIAEKEPALYYRLSLADQNRSNFFLLEDFPPIYPLLEMSDVYLGDYSSIGYDFLVFQKPMFFFQKKHLTHSLLHTCGQILDPNQSLFGAMEKGIQKASLYQERQKALWERAFASDGELQSVWV